MSTNYQFFSDASVKKEVKDELEKLKQFSHHDFPFRVQDMIESTLAVAGDCMQILNYCCDLLEELHRLETYKKQKNKTRIMLLLSRYGSEKSLLNKANSEIATLGRRLQDFDDYVKKIQPNMIEAKGFVCTKCNGRGTVLERTYIRERGSFPQAILKSTPCKTCDGNGIIDFDPEIKEELSKFDSQAVKVLQIFEKHYENVSKYVNDYTPISFEELERTEVRSVSSREELVPVKKTFQQPMKMYYQTIKKKLLGSIQKSIS